MGWEGVGCLANCRADRINGSRGGLSEQVLKLGKDLFDGVQVWRVFWQEEEFGADRTDELSNHFAPVATEIVQDDDVTGLTGRQENFLDIGAEAYAIDRHLDEPWRIDPVMAQGRQEGHGLPGTMEAFV